MTLARAAAAVPPPGPSSPGRQRAAAAGAAGGSPRRLPVAGGRRGAVGCLRSGAGGGAGDTPLARDPPLLPAVCKMGSAQPRLSLGRGQSSAGPFPSPAEGVPRSGSGHGGRGHARQDQHPPWGRGPAGEQMRGRRQGTRLCPAPPPRLSGVRPRLPLQYYSAGEDTAVQFRHCRFLICLFIIQKLAHILMNP